MHLRVSGNLPSPELKAALEEGLEEIISASRGDREESMFRLAAGNRSSVQEQRKSPGILQSMGHQVLTSHLLQENAWEADQG